MSRSGEELGTHLEVAAREEDSPRQLFLFEPVAFREETGTFRIRRVYTDRYVVHDLESIEIPLRVSGSADDIYGDQFLTVEHEADRSFDSRQIFIVATR